MFPIIRSSYLLALLIVTASTVSAQVQTGTPPFNSFGGGADVINLANLNSHNNFPVFHKPGRGQDFIYDLSYETSVWFPAGGAWANLPTWGWPGTTQISTGYITYLTQQKKCFEETRYLYYYIHHAFVYYDAFGQRHSMGGTVQDGTADCATEPLSYTGTAGDGSGYSINVPSYDEDATMTTVVGTSIYPPNNSSSGNGSDTDRNGNTISNASGVFTDTLGMTALTITGSGTPSSPYVYTYKSSTGSSVQYTVKYATFSVQTKFNCSGIAEYGPISNSLVSEIDLPDGSKYIFTYEATPGVSGKVTGRLASIRYPTGGSISYQYSGGGTGVNGISCTDGSAATLTRTTPDGVWTYAQVKGTGAASTTTVTDPQNNQTVIQFQGLYETQRMIYQGSSTLLQTINTCYNGAASPCTATAISLPIGQKTVIATIPGSGNLQSQHTEKFSNYGLTTETDEYDFATAAPFPLLRQTLITYASLSNGLNGFPSSVVVKDGSLNIKSRQDTFYDQYTSFTGSNCISGFGYPCNYIIRANATSVTNYTDPVTPGGAITKTFTFDSTGNMRTAQMNCCQQKSWSYSSTTNYSYPDSVTSGSSSPQLTTSATYDPNMGLVLTTTDPNNVKTTLTYDTSGRVLTSATGTLPASTYTYNDYDNSISFTAWTMQVCAPIQGTNTACRKSILDSQGRTVTSQLRDGSGNLYSASDTQYDAFGRAYRTSNPYTSSPSYWTQVAFDVLGRTTSTTLPDNSVNSIAYTDNAGTTTDPSGKQRKAVSDGLGRLTSVYEPDPSNNNSLTLLTSYTHNVFDELTGVTQASQSRTYTYDALGRLTSSTTPEAGMVCIGTVSGGGCQANTGYDAWGNPIARTDARGVVTSYIYDTLNRLVGVTYPTVPSGVTPMANDCKANGSSTNNAYICFNYGTSAASYNNGRIASTYDAVGSETYTYDQYGNVTQLAKVIGSTTYNTLFIFNLANEITQITYPSGRAVAQNLDTIGRLSSIVGTLNSVQTTYASDYLYNVAQQTAGLKYGNNLYASFGYAADSLLLNCLDYSTTNRNGACTNDLTTKFGLQYSYPASPNNNGRISGITDAVDNGRSASYTYDALYRLTAAVTTGSTNYPKWGLSETYDRYGNRTAQGVTAGTGPMSSVTVSTSTNRITGSPYSYDASGNMTNDGVNTLSYDGENRTAQAVNGGTSGTYSYDGNGFRVKKAATVSGVTTHTDYIFSGAKVIAEYDYTTGSPSPSSPSREYVYSAGALIAKIDSGGTKYYHRDHLSNRLVTDSNGNTLAQIGHYPFGEAWYNASNDKLIFTSYERDAESGNDYAMARYVVNRLARFSSPDKFNGILADPQSLNRYIYASNDPISNVDPMGLCDVVIGGFTEGQGANGPSQFADSIRANQAYPFSGDDEAQSYLDDKSGPESASFQTSYNAVVDALAQTPSDQKVNVFTFSGGADQFSQVYDALSDNLKARIGNITYLSPGGAYYDTLAVSQKGATTVFIGVSSSTEKTVTSTMALSWALNPNITLRTYSCLHDASCAFKAAGEYLSDLHGPTCRAPTVFTKQNPTPPNSSGPTPNSLQSYGGDLAGYMQLWWWEFADFDYFHQDVTFGPVKWAP